MRSAAGYRGRRQKRIRAAGLPPADLCGLRFFGRVITQASPPISASASKIRTITAVVRSMDLVCPGMGDTNRRLADR